MFLITTSYEPSWNYDAKKILFAGEWCRLFSNKEINEKVSNYEIFPYHWANQEDVCHDIEYLNNVYEVYLEYLVSTLNHLHRVNYSKRYWRIIIGVWLHDFIRLIYDYYITIQNIDNSNLASNTYITNLKPQSCIPQDISEFHEFTSNTLYNNCLFSYIIREVSNIPYEVFSSTPNENNGNNESTSIKATFLQKIKRGIKYGLSFLYSSFLVPSKFKKIVFVASYFSKQDLIKIQKKIKQFPMPFLFDPLPIRRKINLKLRKKIEIPSSSNNNFELLLSQLIPVQIPISYVENYASYNFISRIFFPKSPKVIFTANSYFYNEAFKYWAASNTEKGSNLLISQHGAFGETSWCIEENHMIKISDKFYTWGWGGSLKDTFIMPSNKLNSIKEKIKHDPHGKILVVVNSDIINNMHSQKPMLVDKSFKDYIYTLIRMPGLIGPSVSKKIKFRLYHSDYKRQTWGVRDAFIDNGLEKFIDTSNQSFYEAINKSRLAIITYHPNVTGLETLSANFPTLLFWDNEQMKLRDNIQNLYDEFENAGIYHRTLESLISHIEKVNNDVDKWWYSDKVQICVEKYCKKFAYTSNNCVDEWAEELMKYE